jgi:YVTN family beta-propeller protein
MDEDVMRSPDLAAKAGLRKPTKKECLNCHYVKGSHFAVHQLPQLNVEEGLKTIAHLMPEKTTLGPRRSDRPPPKPGPKYVGSAACGACHKGPEMGHQMSVWRMSSHARAYAVLATPKAFETAAKRGLSGEPQKLDACLKCHSTGHGAEASAFLPSFDISRGVGCEACHGPGSEYALEAVMRDKTAARSAGLQPVGRDTCLRCHTGTAEKPYDVEEGMKKLAHPTRPPKAAEGPRYKNPLNLALSPDGRELWVACEASNSVILIEVESRKKIAEIAVGGQPADVAFKPDGSTAYVSNRLDDSVSVVDVATRRVVRTLPVGDEPHGLLTDRTGKTLYVLNTSSDDISVYDTAAFSEIKRLSASRGPWSLALSPDGSSLLVTNTLSRFVKFRQPSVSEATMVDAERGAVDNRVALPEVNLMQGAAWHPSGEFAFVTMNRTKNLVPMTRILQGWTITNGLGVVWRDGSADQVLLDEPNLCFPDAADVAFTPDGRYALVTSSTSDRVAVVDVDKLLSILRQATAEQRQTVLPNHRGKPTEYILKHIPTGRGPRGLLVAPDGRSVFVCETLDDSLAVIEVARLESVGRIDLGGAKEITQARWGERLFNDARIAFQRQFSCHSCHPDGHIDGLTYDIEADGIGVSPVDNRTLRGINDTDPFKWEGTNPSLARQCGARLSVFFTRLAPFTPEELSAVNAYVCTIPRPPNRYRPVGTELTEAQRRGKLIFERSRTNDGRVIDLENRCVTCHFPPLFTDRSRRDVGTRQALDRQGAFDVPHLNNIYDSAPYLHNGIADTLEEIWTRFNPYDQHGVTNDMTKDQLNDLIEYLKTL